MTPYDKINALTDIQGDIADIREKIMRLGNLNANIDTPLYEAIYAIDQALEWQQVLAQDEPKSDLELGLERLAKKQKMTKVEAIDYAKRLADMQGGAAV
ncbi:hypothetical protein [Exiguobacterium sp. s5]|uniref:hypothetical protein n=1 Tax=Exiguobacterium sp. s5 TaxID=2751239 RepID=UPI001BEB2175|nr:hypothetical protein [Exiguobacterium sp. s5]